MHVIPVKTHCLGGWRFLALGLIVFGLVFLGQAAPASAQRATVAYEYLVGSGLLCSRGPTACPAMASAANGDTISLSGQGTFSVYPATATGRGTFLHRSARGAVRGQGTWAAKQLLSFVPYGTSPRLPPTFAGGRAFVLIHLTPTAGGAGFDAVLQITCRVGSPPAGAHEGVRLDVKDLIAFNKEVSGDTLFIRTSS